MSEKKTLSAERISSLAWRLGYVRAWLVSNVDRAEAEAEAGGAQVCRRTLIVEFNRTQLNRVLCQLLRIEGELNRVGNKQSALREAAIGVVSAELSYLGQTIDNLREALGQEEV